MKAALPDIDVVIVDVRTLVLHLSAVRLCHNDAAVVRQEKERVVVAVYKPHIPYPIRIGKGTYARNVDGFLAHLS